MLEDNGLFDFVIGDDVILPLSPDDARMEYIDNNNLHELVESLIVQINKRLIEAMGKNSKDIDFFAPRDKYPVAVIMQIKWLYTHMGWQIRLFDKVEGEVNNLWGLRFTR